MGQSKQDAFVEFYLIEWDGAKAARRAGYSDRSARQIASKLLKDERIQAKIKARLNELTMTADEVLMRQTEIGRGVMQHFMKVQDGKLMLDFTNAADKLYLIKKVEFTTETRTFKGATGLPVTVVEENFKFEVGDYQHALDMLGKHHKLFSERLVVTDWRQDAIEDIRAGKLLFAPLVEWVGETLARDLFRDAGVSVPGEGGGSAEAE